VTGNVNAALSGSVTNDVNAPVRGAAILAEHGLPAVQPHARLVQVEPIEDGAATGRKEHVTAGEPVFECAGLEVDSDRVALGILEQLFPKREIVGIHAVDLVLGLGTLHCSTMQQPQTG